MSGIPGNKGLVPVAAPLVKERGQAVFAKTHRFSSSVSPATPSSGGSSERATYRAPSIHALFSASEDGLQFAPAFVLHNGNRPARGATLAGFIPS